MADGGRAQRRCGERNGRQQGEWRSCEGGGMEGGDVAAIAAGGASRNGASLSSVAAPLLPVVERSHTAAEPALQPPHCPA